MTHTASHSQHKYAACTARRLEQSMSNSPRDSPRKRRYEPNSPPYQYQTKMKTEVAEDPSSQRDKRKRTTNMYSDQVFRLGATTSSPSLVCTLCLGRHANILPKLQCNIPMGWISLTMQMERQNATGLLEWNHPLLRMAVTKRLQEQPACISTHLLRLWFHCPWSPALSSCAEDSLNPLPWLLQSQCLGTATCNPRAICQKQGHPPLSAIWH